MAGGQDLLEEDQSMQVAFFGVLHTIALERWDSAKKFAVTKVVVDWLQLFLLLLLPAHGWVFDRSSWLWDMVMWIQFRTPIVTQVRLQP